MRDDLDYCVICGRYVPEGRQVCHACALDFGLERPVGINLPAKAKESDENDVATSRKKKRFQGGWRWLGKKIFSNEWPN